MTQPRYKQGDDVYFRPLERAIADTQGIIQSIDETITKADGEPWYIVEFPRNIGPHHLLPEAESTLFQSCKKDEHEFGGISAVLEDGHRHDHCTRCGFRGEACYTVSCVACQVFTCKTVSEANMQAAKQALARRRS